VRFRPFPSSTPPSELNRKEREKKGKKKSFYRRITPVSLFNNNNLVLLTYRDYAWKIRQGGKKKKEEVLRGGSDEARFIRLLCLPARAKREKEKKEVLKKLRAPRAKTVPIWRDATAVGGKKGGGEKKGSLEKKGNDEPVPSSGTSSVLPGRAWEKKKHRRGKKKGKDASQQGGEVGVVYRAKFVNIGGVQDRRKGGKKNSSGTGPLLLSLFSSWRRKEEKRRERGLYPKLCKGGEKRGKSLQRTAACPRGPSSLRVWTQGKGGRKRRVAQGAAMNVAPIFSEPPGGEGKRKKGEG